MKARNIFRGATTACAIAIAVAAAPNSAFAIETMCRLLAQELVNVRASITKNGNDLTAAERETGDLRDKVTRRQALIRQWQQVLDEMLSEIARCPTCIMDPFPGNLAGINRLEVANGLRVVVVGLEQKFQHFQIWLREAEQKEQQLRQQRQQLLEEGRQLQRDQRTSGCLGPRQSPQARTPQRQPQATRTPKRQPQATQTTRREPAQTQQPAQAQQAPPAQGDAGAGMMRQIIGIGAGMVIGGAINRAIGGASRGSGGGGSPGRGGCHHRPNHSGMHCGSN